MRKGLTKQIFLLSTLGLLAPAFALAQSITIQGRVTDSNNVPLNGAAVVFHVQILTPDFNRCVLYDETQPQDLSHSSGFFSLNLNGGLSTRQSPTKYGLEEALSNRTGFAIDAGNCKNTSAAVTYSPSPLSNRKIIIEFKDPGSMTNFEAMEEMDLNPVPYAIESRFVGGFESSSFLRVADGGVPAAAPMLSSAQVLELTKLIGGTSDNYMSSVSTTTGAKLPTIGGNPSSLSRGALWFDTVSNALKYYDGSAVQNVGAGGGGGGSGITNITVTAGELTGGGTSSTVNLGLPTVATAGTYGSATSVPRITIDDKGRVTTVALDPITGTVPSAGALDQVLKSNGTGWVSATLRSADIKSTSDGASIFPPSCTGGQFLTWDSVNDKLICTGVTLPAPGATAHSYKIVNVDANGLVTGGSSPSTLDDLGINDGVRNGGNVPKISTGNDTSLPVTALEGELLVASNSNKLYRYSGSAWSEVSPATATGLADVLVAGGALTKSGSAATPTITLSAADASTNGFLSSAKFTEFTNKLTNALASAHIFVGNGGGVATDVPASGDVALDNTGKFTVTGIRGVSVAAGTPVDGQILRYGSSAYSPGFLTMGDLRSTVTGSSALTVGCTASQTLTWNSGTDSLQCTPIGNLSASSINTGTLGVANGGTGATSLNGAGIFVTGGNSFGAAASLGTNDANSLTLKTNNTSVMTLTTGGNVGIGTSNPAGALDVRGGTSSSGNGSSINIFAQNGLASGNTSGGNILLAPGLANNGGSGANGAVYVQGAPNATDAADMIVMDRPFNSGVANNGRAIFSLNRYSSDAAPRSRLDFRVADLDPATPTAVMSLQGNGNVGIGSTTPSELLDVRKDQAGAGTLIRSVNLNASAATYAGVQAQSDAGITRISQFASGAGGSGQLVSNASTLLIDNTSASGVIAFRNGTTPTEKMRITASGNVGIGTSAPGTTLDVNGQAATIRGTASLPGELRFNATNAGTTYVGFKGPASNPTSNVLWQLPAADGTNGQVLSTNGSGALSWVSGSAGSVTSITAGTGLTGGTITSSGTIGLGTELAGLNALSTTGMLKRTGSGTYTAGQASLTADVSGVLPLANGGTNAALSAVNGGVAYSTASAMAFTAAGSAGQMLRSNGAAAPAWSTATFPNTAAIGDLLYASGANTWSSLAKANTAALVTSSTGVPSWVSGATANRLLRTDGTSVTFAQASLATDVTGTLPVANGGTGATTAADKTVFAAPAGGGAPSFRALTTADLPASASYWQAGTPGINYTGGNVGIGTSAPATSLQVGSTASSTSQSITIQGLGNQATPDTLYSSLDFFHKLGAGNNQATWRILSRGKQNTGTAGNLEIYGGAWNNSATFNSTPYFTISQPNGNVGIGTATPTTPLDVVGTDTYMQFLRSNTTDAVALGFSNTGSNRVWGMGVGGTGVGTVGLQGGKFGIWDTTAGASRMVIDTNGRVGVGTISPEAQLTVYNGGITGAGPATSGTTPSTGLVTRFSNPGGAVLDFGMYGNGFQWIQATNWSNQASNYPILLNPNGGNVGIGTSSAGYQLDVNGSSRTNNGYNYIFSNGAAASYNFGVSFNRSRGTAVAPTAVQNGDALGFNAFYGHDGSNYTYGAAINGFVDGTVSSGSVPTAITFNNALGERMRVSSNGNVGIGTTAPTSRLQVAGPDVVFNFNPGAGSPNEGWMRFVSDASANWIQSGNNTPTALAAKDLYLAGWYGAPVLMALKAGGNVGIGTVTPGYKLDVQGGDINTSGSVRANGVALSSDIRYKKDVQALDHALDRLLNIHGVSYRWRTEEFPDKHFNDRTQVGVIAQEVEAQFPELVDTNPKGYKSVNYPALVAPIIEALRELATSLHGHGDRLDTLEKSQRSARAKDAAIHGLESKVNELEARNRELEARLQRIEQSLPKAPSRTPAALNR